MKDEAGELTVGQLLKKRRQAKNLSLSVVEVATKIRGKYLVAFESGNYDRIPNDIYTRGFVASYAEFLGLDVRATVKQYLKERGELAAADRKAPAPVARRRVVVTTRLLAVAFVGLITATVVGYLVWQFSALAAPPTLEVTNPPRDEVIYGSQLSITGHTSGGADVLVNDSPLLTDADGNFTDLLALQDGVNAIHFTARDKLGKQTTVTRNILAHLPQLDPSSARVPAAVFDGVAVAVAIKGSATALTVTVDGQTAFKGTMLAGTTQLFKGNNSVVITTGNAGATNLTITNAQAAGVVISSAGKPGELLRDLTFDKDTVIH